MVMIYRGFRYLSSKYLRCAVDRSDTAGVVKGEYGFLSTTEAVRTLWRIRWGETASSAVEKGEMYLVCYSLVSSPVDQSVRPAARPAHRAHPKTSLGAFKISVNGK